MKMALQLTLDGMIRALRMKVHELGEDHDEADRAQLRSIARDLDLVVTGSSDHHGLGKVGHHLGVNTTAPEEYERLLARRSSLT